MAANDNMSEYSKFASRRYGQYQWQEKKNSIKSQMLDLILRILQALVEIFQSAGIMKRRRVQTVNVE
jgi:hypothetical protein